MWPLNSALLYLSFREREIKGRIKINICYCFIWSMAQLLSALIIVCLGTVCRRWCSSGSSPLLPTAPRLQLRAISLFIYMWLWLWGADINTVKNNLTWHFSLRRPPAVFSKQTPTTRILPPRFLHSLSLSRSTTAVLKHSPGIIKCAV